MLNNDNCFFGFISSYCLFIIDIIVGLLLTMFLKNVFKFVFKLERNYMYFLLQAWQILLHLREYAGFMCCNIV